MSGASALFSMEGGVAIAAVAMANIPFEFELRLPSE
jgi:hypothetical protein